MGCREVIGCVDNHVPVE